MQLALKVKERKKEREKERKTYEQNGNEQKRDKFKRPTVTNFWNDQLEITLQESIQLFQDAKDVQPITNHHQLNMASPKESPNDDLASFKPSLTHL